MKVSIVTVDRQWG